MLLIRSWTARLRFLVVLAGVCLAPSRNLAQEIESKAWDWSLLFDKADVMITARDGRP